MGIIINYILCNLGLHKWETYGDSVEAAFKRYKINNIESTPFLGLIRGCSHCKIVEINDMGTWQRQNGENWTRMKQTLISRFWDEEN